MNPCARRTLGVGSVSAFLAVALGAFGAHALREHLDASQLEIFRTATQYQMTHALALVGLGIGWAAGAIPERDARFSAGCFGFGSIVFCGSLYALVGTGAKLWGAVTPVGGLLFLLGWGRLAWSSLRGGSTS